MLKSFALLFVNNQFFPDDNQYRINKFLLDQLLSINCVVDKIVFVPEQENTVTNELNILYKEYDFVIVIVAGFKCKVVLQALGNICSEELDNQIHLTNNINNHCDSKEIYSTSLRYLKQNNSNDTAEIIFYLGRIYVLKCESVENLFIQLLKDHLQQYQTAVTFSKKIVIINQEKASKRDVEIIDDFVKSKPNEEIVIDLENIHFDMIVEDEIALKQQFIGNKVIASCDINLMMEQIFNSKEQHIEIAYKVSPIFALPLILKYLEHYVKLFIIQLNQYYLWLSAEIYVFHKHN